MSDKEKYEKEVWEWDMQITDYQASEEAVRQMLDSEKSEKKELELQFE